MVEKAVNDLLRQALIDAIKRDQQALDNEPSEPLAPSAQHQKEMAEMLKDPNAWAAKRLQGNDILDSDKR